jgi:hypothetical protein
MSTRPSHITNTSSIKTLPSPGRLTSTKSAPTRKRALRKFNGCKKVRVETSTNPISRASSSTWKMCPVCREPGCSSTAGTVSLKSLLEFFHIRNFRNASVDEAIFYHTLFTHLATNARMLASVLPGSYSRALKSLLRSMHKKIINPKFQRVSGRDG